MLNCTHKLYTVFRILYFTTETKLKSKTKTQKVKGEQNKKKHKRLETDIHVNSTSAKSGISNSIYLLSRVETGKKRFPDLTAYGFKTSLWPHTPQTTWRKYAHRRNTWPIAIIY